MLYNVSVSFCFAMKGISYTCTHMAPSLGPPQEPRHPTTLGHHKAPSSTPCLHSRFPLTVCFTHGCVYRRSEQVKSCPTLCDPMDCSLPGSPIHGIFQARVLEWTAISFSKGYRSILISQVVPPSPSPPRPHVCSLCLRLYSCLANRFICTIFLHST